MIDSIEQESSQLTLFRETHWEQFEKWKELPGAKHIVADIYALAACFKSDWKKYGIQISMKYLFEIERHKIKKVRAKAQCLGARLPKWKGYTLNNCFTAPMVRHIEAHRPDLAGMFEHRESPKKHKRTQLAVVINGRK